MEVYADFHIHVGRSNSGKPIKITGSKELKFENIIEEAANNKGLHMIGIIDCSSPYVIEDIIEYLEKGVAYEQKEGGIIYKDKMCIILGAEVETEEKREDGKKGLAHNLCYFPYLKNMVAFSEEMSGYIKNITLSTQHARLSGYQLIDIVEKHNGILIPAHIFTPHKSYYGHCTDRLKKIFKEKFEKIHAVELGLSADTDYADRIMELSDKKFFTNSDAHSLPKIAREYNTLELEDISFASFKKLVESKQMPEKGSDKNYIVCNNGMNSRLGKYNSTYCDGCEALSQISDEGKCIKCNSKKIVKGVEDRVIEISDGESVSPKLRPEYKYQIPLEYIPKIGKKTKEKMLEMYETEMNILNKVSLDRIEKDFGKIIRDNIAKVRKGKIEINHGGGGNYGSIKK